MHVLYVYVRTMYTTKYTRRKTQKKQLPEVRLRDGHVEHVKVQGPSVKNGVDIWTFVRKVRHPLLLLLFMGVIMIRNIW